MGQFSHFLKPLLFGRNIVLYFIEEEHIMTQNYRDKDMEAWNSYRTFPSPENRSALLRRFDGVINSQVNKWAGPVPRETLLMEARAHEVAFPPKQSIPTIQPRARRWPHMSPTPSNLFPARSIHTRTLYVHRRTSPEPSEHISSPLRL